MEFQAPESLTRILQNKKEEQERRSRVSALNFKVAVDAKHILVAFGETKHAAKNILEYRGESEYKGELVDYLETEPIKVQLESKTVDIFLKEELDFTRDDVRLSKNINIMLSDQSSLDEDENYEYALYKINHLMGIITDSSGRTVDTYEEAQDVLEIVNFIGNAVAERHASRLAQIPTST